MVYFFCNIWRKNTSFFFFLKEKRRGRFGDFLVTIKKKFPVWLSFLLENTWTILNVGNGRSLTAPYQGGGSQPLTNVFWTINDENGNPIESTMCPKFECTLSKPTTSPTSVIFFFLFRCCHVTLRSHFYIT